MRSGIGFSGLEHEPRRLPLRVNFSWVFVSNVVHAASTWLLLIVLVKLGSPELVGIYTLAVAISSPVGVLANLGSTNALVTDQSGACPYGRYVALRIGSALTTMVIVTAVALLAGYPPLTRLVIIVVGANTAVMSLRDLLIAVMKRNENMHFVGISQMALALLMLLAFTGTFWITRSLALAAAAIGLARLAIMVVYDLPRARGLARAFGGGSLTPRWQPRPLLVLALTALPLAFSQTFTALNASVPRYFLEGWHGAEALGYYGAMAAVIPAASKLMNALGIAATPRMARYYIQNRPAFTRIALRLFAIAACVGLGGIFAAVLFGRPILRILFTADYARYQNEFVLIMVHLALLFLVSFLNQGLVASRKFKRVSAAHGSACLLSLGFSWLLVPTLGIAGACWALIWTSTGWLAILALLFIGAARAPAPGGGGQAAAPDSIETTYDGPEGVTP